MTSQQTLDRYGAFIDRTCIEKVAFKTKGEALIFLHTRKYTELNEYRCRFCGLWHVGHPYKNGAKNDH